MHIFFLARLNNWLKPVIHIFFSVDLRLLQDPAIIYQHFKKKIRDRIFHMQNRK